MKIKLLVLLIAITSCGEEKTVDRCLQREIFKECLNNTPKGPINTKYNDWDEVISTCNDISFYQSIRLKYTIKRDCL